MKSLMFTPPAQAEALFDAQEDLWRADRAHSLMPWLDDDASDDASDGGGPPPSLFESIPTGGRAPVSAASPTRRSR
jgi:hypothetical protein